MCAKEICVKKLTKTFIIASTGDRAEGLERLLLSLHPFFESGWRAVVVAQMYDDASLKKACAMHAKFIKVKKLDKLVGAHTAKLIALTSVKSDIWCSLDDDMFAIANTDYNQMADILVNDKTIGLLSGNWAKTYRQANAKEKSEQFVRQKLVYTGGGLMFRDDVAEIVRSIPNKPYLFDDCLWAVYAYINGYNNYRYRGSIAVHQICTKGGRRTWIDTTKAKDRALPPKEYLNVRESKDKEGYYICTDKDVTPLAESLHKQNRKGG